MSSYYKLVNEDAGEVVTGWDVGGMPSLQGWLDGHQARVIAWLLRRASGGHDLFDPGRFVTLGSWAGERITLIGEDDESGLYDRANRFRNIGAVVRDEMRRADN
jgi:hypothetical protein